jgi:hypothetical protein
MKNVLALAAAGEAGLGLVLVVYPPIVVRLLLDADITGAGIVVSRVAGIALIALGVACWPGSDASSSLFRAIRAMLCYSLLVTVYLSYIGISGRLVGILLWPATVFHAILTFLLIRAWLKGQHVDAE